MPGTPAAAEPDPYHIFAKMRHYWENQAYPGTFEYTIAVEVFEGAGSKTERYRSAYDNYVGKLSFNAVSDYEIAHPFYPHGINFGIGASDAPHTAPEVDFYGVPMLTPNFSFGLGKTPLSVPKTPSSADVIREIRAEFHDPNPHPLPTPTAQPIPTLREIVEVTSKVRTYDISFSGTDLVSGTPAYHLTLKPLRDPGRNRLRELWVDEQTYAPLRLVIALNFVTGPGTTVPWLVTFSQQDGVTYIDRETTLAPTRFERHKYSKVIVAFEDVREATRFDFDPSALIPERTFLMQEPCVESSSGFHC
ncbi:MAG TPA: hypothetical protein VGF86_13150 [Candidatus Tumulicola sp.]